MYTLKHKNKKSCNKHLTVSTSISNIVIQRTNQIKNICCTINIFMSLTQTDNTVTLHVNTLMKCLKLACKNIATEERMKIVKKGGEWRRKKDLL